MLYRKNDKGYTLVEILIAIVIGFVLISAATATYVSQNRSQVVQESVSEINTQSKIAHDLIADAIRGAGYGVPADMNQDPVNNFTTIITPIDRLTTGSDTITIVGGFRRIGELWPSGGGPGTTTCPANVALNSTIVRIVLTGTLAPNATNKRFLSIDGIDFLEVDSCTPLGTDCDAAADITLDRPLLQDFPLLDTDGDGNCDVGRPVYLVEDITFCLNGTSLRRIRGETTSGNITGCTGAFDDDEIAKNIEDLQFAYAVDADNDGVIDIAGTLLDAADFVDGDNAAIAADPSIIRAIRVNVLARADRADVNYAGLGNLPDKIENREHDETINDDFRRRWWQTLITMRNQGD